MRNVILAALLAGFVYAGRATAIRCYEILKDPVAPEPAASIDLYLELADVDGAQALRRRVIEAGWMPNDDVLVLAAASAISRQDLYQLYYSTGYVLYPSRVWLAAWCDAHATAAQCETLAAEAPRSAARRHRARRVLLVGDENPFPGSGSTPLSKRVALVTLP